MIRQKILPVTLCVLFSAPLIAGGVNENRIKLVQEVELLPVNADMTAAEYRQASHYNRNNVRDFVETYSRNTLLSLGVPKQGVNMLGAMAGAAIGKDATLYLSDNKSLAINIRDAKQDKRAIFFGYKLKW